MVYNELKQVGQFLEMMKKDHPKVDVLLTLGGAGCVYQKEGKLYRQPSYKTNVVDTTGAGDTFTGYFIAGLYREEPVEELLRTATAASAIAISKEGAAASIPVYETVKTSMATMTLNKAD